MQPERGGHTKRQLDDARKQLCGDRAQLSGIWERVIKTAVVLRRAKEVHHASLARLG
jgi:hypothetical protein